MRRRDSTATGTEERRSAVGVEGVAGGDDVEQKVCGNDGTDVRWRVGLDRTLNLVVISKDLSVRSGEDDGRVSRDVGLHVEEHVV